MPAWTAAYYPAAVKNGALHGLRAAFLHVTALCQEKWHTKFNPGAHEYRSAQSGYKDYLNYVKRKRRADAKRDLLRWRSFEVCTENLDQIWFGGSKSSSKSQKQRNGGKKYSRGWSQSMGENSGGKRHKRSGCNGDDWPFEKNFKGGPYQSRWHFDKSYYAQCWGFTWEFLFHECPSSNETRNNFNTGSSHNRESTRKKNVKMETTIGSASDRQALGLSPTGSLTVEELKKAFRASALKWHPDRHEGAAKVTAEAKFKDCGAAYKSLLSVATRA